MAYYKICGLIIKMNPFQRTESFARPYEIKYTGLADIEINANIDEMRVKYPSYTMEMWEYLASGKYFYHELVKHNGLALHASAVVKDNEAYLFSAKSGTGKSTHTSIWRRVFGDENVKILNDDKPALRLENGVWYAYGTPWSGKTGQNLNLKYPIKGICFLSRGLNNTIERIGTLDAFRKFMSQSSKIKDTDLKEKHIDLVLAMLKEIPAWSMECNMEPEAAIVAYEAMSGEKWRK